MTADMMTSASSSDWHSGGIVAFEGPDDVVSTQLRLLPTAPQILVLPSIQHYLPDSNKLEQPFDACRLIHSLHTAAQARHAEAIDFLKQAGPGENRIVFIHGGTVGAQAQCLSAIREHLTDGDAEEADVVFSQLVSNGVAGLLVKRSPSPRVSQEPKESPKTEEKQETAEAAKPAAETANTMAKTEVVSWETEPEDETTDDDGWESAEGYFDDGQDYATEDPIIRAMRAADLLDKETASLQVDDRFVDLTVRLVDIKRKKRRRLRRSLSFSAVEGLDLLRDQGPATSVSARPSLSMLRNPSIATDVGDKDTLLAVPRRRPLRISIPSPSISWVGDVDMSAISRASLPPRMLGSSPLTAPAEVPSAYRDPRTAGTRLSPVCEGSIATGDGREATEQRQEKEEAGPGAEASSDIRGRDLLEVVEQKVAVDAVDRQSLGVCSSAHDTDVAQQEECARSSAASTVDDEPVQPVLPLVEDLVVLFLSGTTDELLELVVQGFRNGVYPNRSPPLGLGGVQCRNENCPHSARNSNRGSGGSAGLAASRGSAGSGGSSWAHQALAHGLPTPGQSPDPADASPPIRPDLDRIFSFQNAAPPETAVSTQNLLRLLLGSRFPLQEHGYMPRPPSPSIPGASTLWKPLLCDSRRGGVLSSGRKADLILAIGAEGGVRKDRLASVMGKIERLGCKNSGLSRSGRLDLRYLIATTVQAYASSHSRPSKQEASNPFADKSLLAALIIPHLETYLSAHVDVRFLLLEFPADEHLDTVHALQSLMGSDMMKVVSVFNDGPVLHTPWSVPSHHPIPNPPLVLPVSAAAEVPHLLSGRSATFGTPGFSAVHNYHPQLQQQQQQQQQPQQMPAGPPQAPSTYLLASSATESDTAALVAAVRDMLISVSDFYVPEPLYKYPSRRSRGSTATATTTATTAMPPLSTGSSFSISADVTPTSRTASSILGSFRSFGTAGGGGGGAKSLASALLRDRDRDRDRGKERYTSSSVALSVSAVSTSVASATSSLITPPASPSESYAMTGLRAPSAGAGVGLVSARTSTSSVSTIRAVSQDHYRSGHGKSAEKSLSQQRDQQQKDRHRNRHHYHHKDAQEKICIGMEVQTSPTTVPWGSAGYKEEPTGQKHYHQQRGIGAAGKDMFESSGESDGGGGYEDPWSFSTLPIPVAAEREADEMDMEERRLMPMYMRKREDRGSGQKALRLLGLA